MTVHLTPPSAGNGGGPALPPGGAPAQVLAKASTEDFATEWIDPPVPPVIVDELAEHTGASDAVHGIADTAAIIVEGDVRLTNQRTPTSHAASHQDGGSDELAFDASQITSGILNDARIPAAIARDTEVTAAVALKADIGHTHTSNVVYVHKTAAQANATTTLADVTGMSFPVAANTIYLIEYYIFAFAAAATTGLALALNGPAIGTGFLRYGMYATPTATTHFAGGATAYETKLISTGVISTTLPTLHTLYGYLANGATAGTVQLRMSSELAASVTLERGSWGRITQL